MPVVVPSGKAFRAQVDEHVVLRLVFSVSLEGGGLPISATLCLRNVKTRAL